VVLHSRLPKGWTPRTPKSDTHSEFPGTAVLWDEQYYEVLAADALPAGGVRYVLAPWREEHTFRTFEAYDAESEARLLADHEKAATQRKRSLLARCSGILLGHLPSCVQNRLADELGLFPARMTILSILPSLLLFAICVWLYAGSRVALKPSPVPAWLWAFAFLMMIDSLLRFIIAMSQNRGAGSIAGTILYFIAALFIPKLRLPTPRGEQLFTLPPPEDVALRDSMEWRSWMLTLLPPDEQRAIAQRYDYDYRKDAYAVAGAILAVGVVGVLSSIPKLDRFSGFTSLIVAALIVVEQTVRLTSFKNGPAGSIFAHFVRPFVKDLLLPTPRN
jgi:hypothetical protein